MTTGGGWGLAGVLRIIIIKSANPYQVAPHFQGLYKRTEIAQTRGLIW